MRIKFLTTCNATGVPSPPLPRDPGPAPQGSQVHPSQHCGRLRGQHSEVGREGGGGGGGSFAIPLKISPTHIFTLWTGQLFHWMKSIGAYPVDRSWIIRNKLSWKWILFFCLFKNISILSPYIKKIRLKFAAIPPTVEHYCKLSLSPILSEWIALRQITLAKNPDCNYT